MKKIIIIALLFLSGLFGFLISLYVHKKPEVVTIQTFHSPVSFVKQIAHDPHAGEKIFKEFCATCHAAKPIVDLKAPKIDDYNRWKSLQTLGHSKLLQMTITGVGAMPARGGCFECNDEQLQQAISYMLPKRPFIIDTDVGGDDQIAMMYLLNRSDIEVKVISIVGNGEAHCEPALHNVSALLKLSNQSSIPVGCDSEKPLQGDHHFPDWIHKEADAYIGDEENIAQSKTKSAVNLLTQTLKQSSQPIDILAIGPLTNLATLISQHPELKTKINKIVIMGGAFNVPGNIEETDPQLKNKFAEWNIYIDPVAADRVIRSGIPIVLVPLDVTNRVQVDGNFYQQLKTTKNKLGQHAFKLYHRNESEILKHHWYFWDSLTAVLAAEPTLAKCENKNVRIVLTPEQKSGATVVDDINGNKIQVCVSVQQKRFKRMLLEMFSH